MKTLYSVLIAREINCSQNKAENVKSVLLCGCKEEKLTVKVEKETANVHKPCLRKILNICQI